MPAARDVGAGPRPPPQEWVWDRHGVRLPARQPNRVHGRTGHTVLRATLFYVKLEKRNITLSLPEEDLREARVLAAKRATSVSQLVARALREIVERESGYGAARERSTARLHAGACLGTGGHPSWSRNELHER